VDRKRLRTRGAAKWGGESGDKEGGGKSERWRDRENG